MLQSLSKVTGLINEEVRIITRLLLVFVQGFLLHCMGFHVVQSLSKGRILCNSRRASGSMIPAELGWSPGLKDLPHGYSRFLFETLIFHCATLPLKDMQRHKATTWENTPRSPGPAPGAGWKHSPWRQESQPQCTVRWDIRQRACLGTQVAFCFETVSQPSATYRPKRSGNHALCLPSHGWAQKNLHQDLGELFARNVRNAHKKRQLHVGVDERTIRKFEKARIQYFSL